MCINMMSIRRVERGDSSWVLVVSELVEFAASGDKEAPSELLSVVFHSFYSLSPSAAQASVLIPTFTVCVCRLQPR